MHEPDVKIIKVNNVHLKVLADPGIVFELQEAFTFFVPGYKFTPKYKSGMWDGKIRLLHAMTGMLYIGLLKKLINECKKLGYSYEVDPELTTFKEYPEEHFDELIDSLNLPFEPYEYQTSSFQFGVNYNRALFLSPTGSGKSLIIYLLAMHHLQQNRNILIIVPTKVLLNQLASNFIDDYGMKDDISILKISAGVKRNQYADITISTWQSIYKESQDFFDGYGVIIGDEAHLFKAKSLTTIMEKTQNIEFKYGLTGTLDESLTNKLVLEGVFGPVVEVEKTRNLIDQGVLSPFNIKALVLEYPEEEKKAIKDFSYRQEIDRIVDDERRTNFIYNLVMNLEGNTLVLFQYIEKHGDKIYEKFTGIEDRDIFYIHGSSNDEMEDVRKHIKNSKKNNNIILGSYGMMSTGVDLPRLDNLVFASPYRSKIKVLQSVGRVLRKSKDKKAVLYDIVDDYSYKKHKNYTFRHFLHRFKLYNEEGFDVKVYKHKVK